MDLSTHDIIFYLWSFLTKYSSVLSWLHYWESKVTGSMIQLTQRLRRQLLNIWGLLQVSFEPSNLLTAYDFLWADLLAWQELCKFSDINPCLCKVSRVPGGSLRCLASIVSVCKVKYSLVIQISDTYFLPYLHRKGCFPTVCYVGHSRG